MSTTWHDTDDAEVQDAYAESTTDELVTSVCTLERLAATMLPDAAENLRHEARLIRAEILRRCGEAS